MHHAQLAGSPADLGLQSAAMQKKVAQNQLAAVPPPPDGEIVNGLYALNSIIDSLETTAML